ncbi:hypothetical protein L484_014610 [Morus notabilis]|uniref:Uncharacterized protein n=1 Tax=Morus notabilis TaxID=981085 RepID=W9QYG1_9ROSA|nr:hypothetical protein L484_014610 [Morus notabilis]
MTLFSEGAIDVLAPWPKELSISVTEQMPISTSGAKASSEQGDEEEDPEIEALYNEPKLARHSQNRKAIRSHAQVRLQTSNLGLRSRRWTTSVICTTSPTMFCSWPLG